MHAVVPRVPQRPPRRARYLVPPGTPRRGEVLAAVAAAAVAAGVLFAPLTLILAATFHAVSKVSRWRPAWLWVPAACGIVWVVGAGPPAAEVSFGHGPAATASALPRIFTGPAGLARAAGAVGRGLPGQLPLALILGAAVAALAWWLRWLHTDEWDVPAARPGLVHTGRRRRTVASLRGGRVLTGDGARLGVDEATGGPAVLSWRDAGGGVLLTGAAEPAVHALGLRLAHAAIRRRKPVIVVDLAGAAEVPGALAGICASVGAPLHVFGAAGGPRYEPRVRPSAEQHAALLAVPWGPRPGLGAGERVGLDEVVRQRSVALFALAGPWPGDAAEVIAGLVAADVAALYGGLYRRGIAPDGLCWFTECDGVEPAALAGLVAAGSPAGLAPVLATTVPRAAGGLAGLVNAVVIHQLTDRDLAGELAALTGSTIVPLSRAPAPAGAEYANHSPLRAEASPAVPFGTVLVPLVPADSLCALSSGEFVLVAGLAAAPAGGRRRGGAGVTIRARCRAVSAPVPARPEPPALPGGAGLPAVRWPA
jgi:hypothetical protein